MRPDQQAMADALATDMAHPAFKRGERLSDRVRPCAAPNLCPDTF